jgi:hypothetical protein
LPNHGNQIREILERAGLRNAKVFGSAQGSASGRGRLNEVLGDIRKIENDLTPGPVRALG